MAISQDLIIGIEDFRYFANVSDSFDAEFIAPLIVRATDVISQKVLGTALTRKLITDYNANTLTGLYETLYDSDEASVKKMVIWQAYKLGIVRFVYKISNGQITKGNNIESQPIEGFDIGTISRDADATLTLYENRVKKYLLENYRDIPELSNNTPEYLKPNLEKSDSAQGLTYSQNLTWEDI